MPMPPRGLIFNPRERDPRLNDLNGNADTDRKILLALIKGVGAFLTFAAVEATLWSIEAENLRYNSPEAELWDYGYRDNYYFDYKAPVVGGLGPCGVLDDVEVRFEIQTGQENEFGETIIREVSVCSGVFNEAHVVEVSSNA